MKTYTNTDLVHAFAQRNQENGKASNMFFEKDRIYSYGRHYLLAEFIEHECETFILINDKGYSNSTAKHICLVRQATRQYRQFFTTNVDFQLVYNEIKSLYEKLGKAKKPLTYIDAIKAKFNGLVTYPLFDKVYHNPERFVEIREIYDNVCSMDTTELRAKIVEQNKAKDLKRVQDFLNFETDYLIRDFDLIRVKGEIVETSQGVKVSKEVVKSLYERLKNKDNVVGSKVSDYTVIANNNGVIKIGCHNLRISENVNILETL